MNRTLAMTLFLCLVIFTAGSVGRASAQPDREVRNKQGQLKKEYNDVQEKNQAVREIAKDKQVPQSGASSRRRNLKSGYDFTKVKGFYMKSTDLQTRVDQLFKRAAELGVANFDEEYHLNGQTVPCKTGQGGSAITGVEVYTVEATAEEIEKDGINPNELIEVRVIKQENCPPEAKGDEEDAGDDEGGRRRRTSTQEQPPKQYILSGMDLWAAIKANDEGLYDASNSCSKS